MKKFIASFFVMVLVVAVIALNPVWGQEKNHWVNKAVTDTIRALDGGFFKGFDVYSAGVKEAPTALLFDIKDDYHLPTQFWGDPLSEEEIIYALYRLDDQYNDPAYDIRFEPRALNIVNLKGEVLGYCFTSMTSILMDRKKDGRVTVFRPPLPTYGGGGDYGIAPSGP